MTSLILALLVAGLPLAAQDDPVAVVDAFHDALNSGDGDAAIAQMAPDVVIFEAGGAEMSRDEYAGGHLGGDMRFAAVVQREVADRQHAIAGDVAWVLTRTRTTGTMGEREIDSRGVETMVLRRTDEGWKIVHIHWSSRAARRQ